MLGIRVDAAYIFPARPRLTEINASWRRATGRLRDVFCTNEEPDSAARNITKFLKLFGISGGNWGGKIDKRETYRALGNFRNSPCSAVTRLESDARVRLEPRSSSISAKGTILERRTKLHLSKVCVPIYPFRRKREIKSTRNSFRRWFEMSRWELSPMVDWQAERKVVDTVEKN